MTNSDGVFGIPHGIANGADEPLPYALGLLAAVLTYEAVDDRRVVAVAAAAGVIVGLVIKTTTEIAFDPI